MTAQPHPKDIDEAALHVRQAMRGPPLSIQAKLTVREACRILRSSGVAEALVFRDEGGDSVSRLLGILTHSDLIGLLAQEQSPGDRLVTTVMQPQVHTIDIGRTVDAALFELHRLRVHRLPVTNGDRIIGLLTLESLLEAKTRELDRLRLTTAHLAAAATHDPLTQLANRRLFDEALPRELARSRRSGRGLGLLMIDIDHFKQVNDEYGHQRGDLVLQELSARLLSTVRRADLVARYGGEEFVVVASIPNASALVTLAEKLRNQIKSVPFSQEPTFSLQPRVSQGPEPLLHSGPLRVTISVGAALLTPDMESPGDLVGAADGALYQAKQTGRDCVWLAYPVEAGVRTARVSLAQLEDDK